MAHVVPAGLMNVHKRYSNLFNVHNQLMKVKKIDTVKADADVQLEVSNVFRLRRFRHDRANSNPAFE